MTLCYLDLIWQQCWDTGEEERIKDNSEQMAGRKEQEAKMGRWGRRGNEGRIRMRKNEEEDTGGGGRGGGVGGSGSNVLYTSLIVLSPLSWPLLG